MICFLMVPKVEHQASFCQLMHICSRPKTAIAHKLQPSQLLNVNNHCEWVWWLRASFCWQVCQYCSYSFIIIRNNFWMLHWHKDTGKNTVVLFWMDSLNWSKKDVWIKTSTMLYIFFLTFCSNPEKKSTFKNDSTVFTVFWSNYVALLNIRDLLWL